MSFSSAGKKLVEKKAKREKKNRKKKGRKRRKKKEKKERGRESYVIMIHISLTSSFKLKHYYCS